MALSRQWPWRVRAPRDELAAALRPWMRWLLLESGVRWLVRGLIAALLVACVPMAVQWFIPWPREEARRLALELATPVLVLFMARGLWPVPPARRAFELDNRLQAADRFATAWQDRGATNPFARLQRADALRLLAGRTPGETIGIRWSEAEIVLLAVAAFVTGLLAIMQSPMDSVIRARAAQQVAIQRAIASVEQERQSLAAQPGLSPEQVKQISAQLAQLEQQLADARSQQDALTALAAANQTLGQLADPAADSKQTGLASAGQVLAGAASTQPLGQALQGMDDQATAQALQQLAQQLNGMSDTQRQQVAQTLQRAATASRGNPAAASALRQAASAATPGGQGDSLDSATTSLQNAIQAASAQTALQDAQQNLSDLQNGISTGSLSDPTPGANPAASTASGGLPLPTAGTDAQTAATPVGVAPGAQPGVAQGSQRSESNAPGGEQAGVGPGTFAQSPTDVQLPNGAQPESVFIPGQSSGPSAIQGTARVAPSGGQSVPYTQVLGQYSQSGRDYVQSADIPSAVRDQVKQYFSDLGGQ